MAKYRPILSSLYKLLGKGITDANQLLTVGKRLLGPKFLGAFPQDRAPRDLRKGDMFLLNTDKAGKSGTHWVAIYYAQPKFIIYDSYGRNSTRLLPHFVKSIGYKFADTDPDAEQSRAAKDCGQRSIGFLLLLKRHGIATAMKL